MDKFLVHSKSSGLYKAVRVYLCRDNDCDFSIMLSKPTVISSACGYFAPILIYGVFALMLDNHPGDYASFETFMTPVAGLLSALTWFAAVTKDRKLENVQASLFTAVAVTYAAGSSALPTSYDDRWNSIIIQWPKYTTILSIALLLIIQAVTYFNQWANIDEI